VSHNPHEQRAHAAKPRHEAPLMAKKLRLVDIEVRADVRGRLPAAPTGRPR